MRQQLIKDTGGRLYAEFTGRPSAATVTIKRSNGADVEGSSVVAENATVDPFVATFDEDTSSDIPAEGGKAIPVQFSEGTLPVPGQGVLIRTPFRFDQFNIVSLFYYSNESERRAVLFVRQPFQIRPSEGTTISATRVYFDLSAEQCPRIETDFRAVFTATIDGATVRKEVLFDVGLRSSDNPATVRDILDEWPDLAESESYEWFLEQGFPAIEGGWRDVWLRIEAAEKNPNRIRDVDPLKGLIVNRAVRRLAKYGSVPPVWSDRIPEFIDLLDEDFKAQFDQVFAGLRWYDEEDDGIKSAADELKIVQVKLTR